MEKRLLKDAQQFNEERFTKVDIIKNRRSSSFLLNFLPEQHMRPHNHPNRELYMHVLEGKGTLFVDDDELEISQGDVIFFEEDEKIGFTNTGTENVTIFATLTKMGEK